ncbi:unnamed protein product, partial [Rotaria sp. Silwood1]
MSWNIWEIVASVVHIYLCCYLINCPVLLNGLTLPCMTKSHAFGSNITALGLLYCNKELSNPMCVDIDISTCGSSMLE